LARVTPRHWAPDWPQRWMGAASMAWCFAVMANCRCLCTTLAATDRPTRISPSSGETQACTVLRASCLAVCCWVLFLLVQKGSPLLVSGPESAGLRRPAVAGRCQPWLPLMQAQRQQPLKDSGGAGWKVSRANEENWLVIGYMRYSVCVYSKQTCELFDSVQGQEEHSARRRTPAGNKTMWEQQQ